MLYLASKSPRRGELIRRLNYPYKVIPSAYRESNRCSDSPERNVMRNAVGKARRARLPQTTKRGVVIGVDTLVYCAGRLLGKPRSWKQALEMLSLLSGRGHWVYSGVALRDLASGTERVFYEKTRVFFRRLKPEALKQLMREYHALDKAGAYAVQEDRGRLISRIVGSRSNVIGLPLERLRRELKFFK